MNFGTIVSALAWAAEHRKELAEGAEIGIHLIRRIEHLCVHHETTADKVLVAAGDALSAIAGDNDEEHSTSDSGARNFHSFAGRVDPSGDDLIVDNS